MAEEVVNKGTTETRIRIVEDRYGNFTVEHVTVIKDTEVVVPIRFSHLIGQLFVASIILLIRNYKKLLSFEKSNSTLGESKAKK